MEALREAICQVTEAAEPCSVRHVYYLGIGLVLERDPRWVVAFDAATRRLTQIVRLNDAQNAVEKELFDLGAGLPVPDFMWSMVEGQRPVVLCGPLRGEPTDENLHSAKQAGTLRGIATRTLIS